MSSSNLPRAGGKVIKGPALGEGTVVSDKPIVRHLRPNIVNAEEFEARQSARQVLDDADAKAREIIAQAERERDEIYERAAQEARAEVLAQATEELARAKVQAGEILKSQDGDVLELALAVARKIIGRDLERDPEVLLEIVATAIEGLRGARAMVLRLNPTDAALVRDKRPKLIEYLGRSVDIAIRDDADVEQGGCVIQTEFGTIDAQLRTQLEMLRNVLYPETGTRDASR